MEPTVLQQQLRMSDLVRGQVAVVTRFVVGGLEACRMRHKIALLPAQPEKLAQVRAYSVLLIEAIFLGH